MRVGERPWALLSVGATGQSAGVQFGKNEHQEQVAHEAQAAYAVKRHAEKKAVQVAHAPIPAYDYISGRLTPGRAQEYAARRFQGKSEAGLTGQELLQWLTTPKASTLALIPNVEQLSGFELGRLAKTEKQLRAWSQATGVSIATLYTALEAARRAGLVYQLKDIKRGETYYGVPQEVRLVLNLQPPVEEVAVKGIQPAAPSAKPALTAFGQAIQTFLEQAAALPPQDERFEYAGQLAAAAIDAELVPSGSIPEAIRGTMSRDGYIESISGTLLNLYESSVGTPLLGAVADLCQAAVNNGALEAEDYDSVRQASRLSISA
jgi:hypothetical protein